nr:hypothetical protein [Tanacetum cinerariifolium]
MLATINQIANLLSGLQKQFPPTNNQLHTSSNPKTHATVYDGQIVTKTVQRRAPGNTGTKGHVARQCKEPKRARDSQWVNDEHKLVNATLTAELEWCKIKMHALEWHALPVYWLPAAEIASQSSTPAKPVAPFVHT